VAGVIVLQITVNTDGRADNVSIVKGLGYGLDEASIDAVRDWRFKPAMNEDDMPVPSSLTIHIPF
jgi:protein TonB